MRLENYLKRGRIQIIIDGTATLSYTARPYIPTAAPLSTVTVTRFTPRSDRARVHPPKLSANHSLFFRLLVAN